MKLNQRRTNAGVIEASGSTSIQMSRKVLSDHSIIRRPDCLSDGSEQTASPAMTVKQREALQGQCHKHGVVGYEWSDLDRLRIFTATSSSRLVLNFLGTREDEADHNNV